MNSELKKLYPSALWESFASICDIPHPSKHEEQILAFLKDWAKKNNIECEQDETGNLIFRKPATPGMENRTPVILQGHIDMVPQANSDKKHDFTKDPIKTVIGSDGWLRADGTTLGADNGIGCAAGMALLLAKDVQHGPLEVLITVDEETGMTGAFGLKKGFVKGDILINLDSETEGEMYVGCAGGLDANIEDEYVLEPMPAGMKAFRVFISGLKGGHSGMDINLGRANANKLITRLLQKSKEDMGIRISTIHGGSLRNAIAREAEAIVAVPENNAARFEDFVKNYTEVLRKEFSATEPDLTIDLTVVELPAQVVAECCDSRILHMAYSLPHGVLRMSDSMKDLVETSNNFAIFNLENGKLLMANLLRSSVDSAKEALGEKMRSIAELAGAKISLTGAYPGWKPNMESPVLKTAIKTYTEKYGATPKIMAIHAGLECGLFGVSYPNWDMISFGPTIMNPHSPDERVNIESVGKFWDFLVALMGNIPVK
ncbi:aminoacyl-histidine dipeptidase [Bacteroidales bacterium OttesenSCG-928-B11]|nr:aminoacyl-histidine dipeptidase [Bacteroidales bacterium OttesenSCG-928-B11]MDL2326585.1 aminoacyl-histidine dipeptidase [Bacteroidales bacterium OttesenSCG-928-A14]